MAGVEKECLDAFCFGKKEEALKLLSKLPSPETITDSRDFWKGPTLVHHAARHGWEDVCKLLVEKYNCQPTTVDDGGYSPLHVACFSGKKAVVKYLLSLPSILRRTNDKNNFGRTPLHLVCFWRKIAIVEILLETNLANVAEEDEFGLTPFEFLSECGYNVLSGVANKIDWSTQLKVGSFFNVFLVGNTAAGKSTLAATMLELTRVDPTQHGRISNVQELTAGVVPTRCDG